MDGRTAVDGAAIEAAVRAILAAIGEDPGRPGLEATPSRVARMYAELFSGVGRDPAHEIDVVAAAPYDELVLMRDVAVASVCEHHLIPFVGRAHVGYVPGPGGRITGLSKLARVVDVAARRPQVQERLTAQVADAIETKLAPRGVFVVIEAEHLCMTIRGVQKPGAVTVTSALRGILRDDAALRDQALRLIRR